MKMIPRRGELMKKQALAFALSILIFILEWPFPGKKIPEKI
jgi:hypothetical protein